jgi:hypothetical protein
MSGSLRRQGWYDTFSSRGKRHQCYAGPVSKAEAYQAMAKKRTDIKHRGTDSRKGDGEVE